MDTILVITTLVSLALAAFLLLLNARLIRYERRRSAARVEALRAAALEPIVGGASPAGGGHDLFRTPADADGVFRPFARPGALAALGVGVVVAGLAIWGLRGQPAAGTVAAPVPPAPIELLALQHERAGTTLSVSGKVRNPSTDRHVSDVNVMVSAFDEAGTPVRKVAGPIDVRTLAPGDESPFTVTLSLEGTSTIGRYRVSFEAGDQVVPHVDRRGGL
jgi:hypothetical protein